MGCHSSHLHPPVQSVHPTHTPNLRLWCPRLWTRSSSGLLGSFFLRRPTNAVSSAGVGPGWVFCHSVAMKSVEEQSAYSEQTKTYLNVSPKINSAKVLFLTKPELTFEACFHKPAAYFEKPKVLFYKACLSFSAFAVSVLRRAWRSPFSLLCFWGNLDIRGRTATFPDKEGLWYHSNRVQNMDPSSFVSV